MAYCINNGQVVELADIEVERDVTLAAAFVCDGFGLLVIASCVIIQVKTILGISIGCCETNRVEYLLVGVAL